jgi:hypothetical protein
VQGMCEGLVYSYIDLLQHLNLSGIPHLRSRDLSGLMSETVDEGPPSLEELVLNHTGLDDEAAPFLSCCSSLVALEVAGTKLTSSSCMVVVFPMS